VSRQRLLSVPDWFIAVGAFVAVKSRFSWKAN
jgi:hypothetical protein